MLNKTIAILLIKFRSTKGLTIRAFLVVLLVIGTFSAIGIMGLMDFKKTALRTIVRYDLKKLFEAEQVYHSSHDTFKGSVGDIISNDPTISSTFTLEGFSPSANTTITIIDDDPFTAVGNNGGFEIILVYDIKTNIIREE
jgi:hypothetical protein